MENDGSSSLRFGLVSRSTRGKYDRSQTASERAEILREKLLDHATEVFAARGFRDTRVDDIVEHARISRRTLYQHFDSLEAILEEIYERAVRVDFTGILQRLMGVSDPIERIRTGVAAYFDLIVEHPAAAKVVFCEYRSAGAKQAAKYDLNTSRYVALLYEALTAAYAAQRLGRAPDEVTVYGLVKGLEAVGVRALERGELATLATITPRMAALVIDAFRQASESTAR